MVAYICFKKQESQPEFWDRLQEDRIRRLSLQPFAWTREPGAKHTPVRPPELAKPRVRSRMRGNLRDRLAFASLLMLAKTTAGTL
jgi:hypothetical protein